MVERRLVKPVVESSSLSSSAKYSCVRRRWRVVTVCKTVARRVDRAVMCKPAKLWLPFIGHGGSIPLLSAIKTAGSGRDFQVLWQRWFYCTGSKNRLLGFDSPGYRKNNVMLILVMK